MLVEAGRCGIRGLSVVLGTALAGQPITKSGLCLTS